MGKIVLRRLLRIAGVLAAIAFAGSIVDANYDQYRANRNLHPSPVVPAGHLLQVERVRRHVRADAPLLYIDDTGEVWQSRMWQRSMYPDHVVVHAVGMEHARRARERYALGGRPIHFAVITRSSRMPPGIGSATSLPDYPGGIPVALVAWSDGPSPR